MAFFKNRTVALVITALVVVGCVVYGFTKKPADLISVKENVWVADSANVLSGQTESSVTGYNKIWDSSVSSVVAVASVKSTKGWDIEDYALDLGEKWGLGKNDMLLLLDIGGDEYTIVYTASKIISDSDVNAALASSGFGSAFSAGDYNAAVQDFFSALDGCYSALPLGCGGDLFSPDHFYYDSDYGSGLSTAVLIVIPLLILLLLVSAVDRARYRTWRGRYHGVKGAPVFIPILFWHRPGGAWSRQMNAGMRMPFDRRRGPGGRGGGFGGGFGGGRGGGFGGGFGGGRGGGFGGRR